MACDWPLAQSVKESYNYAASDKSKMFLPEATISLWYDWNYKYLVPLLKELILNQLICSGS